VCRCRHTTAKALSIKVADRLIPALLTHRQDPTAASDRIATAHHHFCPRAEKSLSQNALETRVYLVGALLRAEEASVRGGHGEIDDLFHDVVLVLGGVFASRGTDSETIWRISRGLERVYLRARNRACGTASSRVTALTPHPALMRLFRLIDGQTSART
jgi:hypothetical protein